MQNVEVVVADALKTGLERSSYDFVHERLILINLPPASQEALLTEMLSVLKPGGTIALQDFDSASYVCYPAHPSWDILLGVWNDSFHATGGNEFVGRSIGHLLRSAGVENVLMKAHVEVAQVGEYRRTHLLSLLQSMEDLVVASGRLSRAELKKHIAASSEHLADPGTTLIDKLIVQAWGPEAALNPGERQLLCWFLDAGNNERPARSTDRRPKSAKARSRARLGRDDAASYGIWLAGLIRSQATKFADARWVAGHNFSVVARSLLTSTINLGRPRDFNELRVAKISRFASSELTAGKLPLY